MKTTAIILLVVSCFVAVLALPTKERPAETPLQLRPVRQLRSKVGEQGPPPPREGPRGPPPSPAELKKFKELAEKAGDPAAVKELDKEGLEGAESFYHHYGFYPSYYHYPSYYYPYYYPYYSYGYPYYW